MGLKDKLNKISKPDLKKYELAVIFAALGEASQAGLKVFVEGHKLQKAVEVLHTFDKEKSSEDNIPAVLITFQPIENDSKLLEISNFREKKDLIN